METELTRDEIIRLFDSGHLLQTISERSRSHLTSDLSKTEALCIELHNDGIIDVLSLANEDRLAVIETSSFFGAAHAICRLIPHLTSDATVLMQSVDRLIARAGNDLAANWPNGELLEWFVRHPEEAQTVVTSARQGEPLAIRHVTFALQALNVTDQARSMAKDFVDERRLAAITSLSRIEEVDKDGYQMSLALFSKLLEHSPDDALQAHILGAASWMFEKCDDAMRAAAADVIRRAATGGEKMTRWSAARSLLHYGALVESEAFNPLIDLLSKTTAEELGTVQIIDGASKALFLAGKAEQTVKLVSILIDNSEGKLTLAKFSSFVSSLSTSGAELGRATLAWLLSGSDALCSGLLWHFQRSNELAGPVITVPPDALPKTDRDREFVARKAVGWLILKPVTAASILVSLLRVCGGRAADEIAGLLASMLLANYGSVQTYLVTLRDDPTVGARIAGMLAANKRYLDELQSVPDMPELRPSESHLRAQHERHALRARETSKATRKQSVFMSMIKQSRILHGAGTLSTVYGLGGEKRYVNTPFRKIGYSVELPRLESIDPIGFDMALLAFRLERRIS